ncbi:BA14K family protein [Neorhizobium petrolearium]|uniref:Lectin-like protein BA14k n=1 Tax=Neorhizobium petrolearium TaxID=515361 RepID=A0ABY8M367_9HYPH|nr:BA14K family protein [Neorhizobium petrolearium]MCC2608739.1 BA14K family protein [Neorhizobium petrolearium]WGI68998.1 BA14K family protein [Neorhizobium petrolearium]
MNAIRLRLTTVAAAFAVALTSLTPARSFQTQPIPGISNSTTITQVQYRDRRDWHRDRDRYGWYNGHRGYRDRRPGYRYHNGFWFPLAAFATGAIIGGAIANDRAGYSSRHVAWCESRYRTYRAYDNTYVPRVGVRAQCISPYR